MTRWNRKGLRSLCATSFAVLVVLLAGIGTASAAPGDADGSFDLDGFATTDFAADPFATSVVQQGSKLLVGGHTGYGSFMMSGDFALARYNYDGSLDTTFNAAGPTPGTVVNPVGSSTEASAEIALLSDGKILQVGTVDGQADPNPGWFGLARYDADGVLDGTFDTDGEVTTQWPGFEQNSVYGMDVDDKGTPDPADDRYVVVGRGFEDDGAPGVSGARRVLIARYNWNGELDTGFDGDGRVVLSQGDDPWAVDVVVQPGGKVVIGGGVQGANPAFFLARFESDGELDTTFESGGFVTNPVGTTGAEPFDLIAQPDGKLLLAGQADYDNIAIARYSSDGELDNTFGEGDGVAIQALLGMIYPQPYELRVQGDGKIFVGGTILADGASPVPYLHQFMLARFTAAGALDTSFGGGDGWVTTAQGATNTHGRALTIQSDGKPVVAGALEYTSTPNPKFYFALARYQNDFVPAPQPAVAISPSAWDFGSTPVGQRSAAKLFTVTNTGSAPLDVTGLSIFTPFEGSTGQTCTAMTLAPGERCDLPLRFAPTSATKYGPSEYVRIRTNAPGSPHFITLGGTGTNPPDTTKPDLKINAIGSVPEGHTNDTTPAISGQAGTAAGDRTEIRVLADKLINGVWENLGSTSVQRSGGGWSLDWPSALSDGLHRIRAVQRDDSGNEQLVTTEFTVDTKKPTMSIFYPTDLMRFKEGDDVLLVGFGSTGGGEKRVSAQIFYDVPGKGWEQRSAPTGTRYNDGSWGFDLGKQAPGHWFAWVFLSDAAGNEERAAVQWWVDGNAKPEIKVYTPTNNASFRQNETVSPVVSCSDPEDGALPCKNIPILETASTGPKTFTATATDSKGQTTRVDVPYTVLPPLATKGIKVQGIELTQGTQTYGLEEPEAGAGLLKKPGIGFGVRQAKYLGVNVVPNKKTLARVFLDLDGKRQVSVYLYVFDGNRLVTGPLSSLKPSSLDISNASALDKQRKVDGGLVFNIPPSAVTGSFDVVAVAIPNTTPSPDACPDCGEVNGFALTGISPKSPRGWRFKMLQVNVNDNDPPSVVDDLKKALDIYPVDPSDVTIPAKYSAVIDGDPIQGTTTKRQGEILDILDKWDEAQAENLTQSTIGVAVAPPSHLAGGVSDGETVFTPKECVTGGGFLGIGQTTTCYYRRAGIVIGANNRPYTSVGHELGHAVGREHASKACKGGTDGQVGESWPPDQVGYLNGIGFDVNGAINGSPRLLDGGTKKAWDFMSYCTSPLGNGDPTAWTSPKGWESLFEHLYSRTLPAVGGISMNRRRLAAAGEPALVVRAISDPSGNYEITSIEPGTGTQGPAGSAFNVAMKDASGKILSTAPMKTRVLHPNDGSGATYFALETTVPASGAASMALVNDAGATLATETKSPNAPTVSVTSPKAGSRVGGKSTVEVAWSAADRDGGDLSSTVDYSLNGGRTWRTIAETPDRSIRLDRALLGASKNARVRVTVNDGWNETRAVSGRFTSLGAAPAVAVLEPTRRLKATNDQAVALAATATDDRDVQLGGKAITWTLGKRVIGRGARASATGLPAGRLKIVVEARDRLGRVARDSVRIRLAQATPRFTKLVAPRKISRTARTLSFRAATSVPARLRVGRRSFALGSRLTKVTVAVKPGKRALGLPLKLKAGGKRSRAILVVRR